MQDRVPDGYLWHGGTTSQHHVGLRTAQRQTRLSAARKEFKINHLYTYLHLQPSAIRVWAHLYGIPAALVGVLGNVQTLEHRGSSYVMVSFKENHFKRMGTLIAMLAIIKQGNNLSALPLDPALILRCTKRKVILNNHHLLLNTNPISVTNANYMRDHFVPYLKHEL